MSLRKAIEVILEESQKDYQDGVDITLFWSLIKSKLNIALKSSEDEKKNDTDFLSPKQKEILHRNDLKNRQDLKNNDLEPRFIHAVGGDFDGGVLPTDPDTPINAKTMIDGQIYQFDGQQWNFIDHSSMNEFSNR